VHADLHGPCIVFSAIEYLDKRRSRYHRRGVERVQRLPVHRRFANRIGKDGCRIGRNHRVAGIRPGERANLPGAVEITARLPRKAQTQNQGRSTQNSPQARTPRCCSQGFRARLRARRCSASRNLRAASLSGAKSSTLRRFAPPLVRLRHGTAPRQDRFPPRWRRDRAERPLPQRQSPQRHRRFARPGRRDRCRGFIVGVSMQSPLIFGLACTRSPLICSRNPSSMCSSESDCCSGSEASASPSNRMARSAAARSPRSASCAHGKPFVTSASGTNGLQWARSRPRPRPGSQGFGGDLVSDDPSLARARCPQSPRAAYGTKCSPDSPE